jgi:predicted RNase H-like nuclease (RuvC/YqgF family)
MNEMEEKDKQTKKEEIKKEKSDLMVIVEAINKGFEMLGNKIDALGKKIDTGFEALGKKIDALGNKIDNLGKKIDNVNDNIGKLTDVFEKYISRKNEWTSLNLYLNKIEKTLKDELNLKNYRLHIESEQEGADFLVKIKEKNEIKAYIIVEVKDFPSENSIIKAYEQIEKTIKEDIPLEHKEEKKEKGKKTITFKVPVIATILFRFWEEDPLELVEIIRNVLKEKVNVKFYDFHIGCFYGNKYYIISLFNYG